MSNSFDFRMEGFKELDNLLKELPQRVENKILQRAVSGAMKEAFTEIQRRSPKHLTGDQSANSKKYGSILSNLRQKKSRAARGSRSAKVSTGDAFWAYFYEKGTRHQPARPWFDAAFRAAQGKILEKLEALLSQGIADEAKKLEK